MKDFSKYSRKELLKLLEVYAKNWLAHDGCWFLAVEETYGLKKAIELDAKSWERFAASEAKRIMKKFEIEPNGGLRALKKAFQYRLYTAINSYEAELIDDTAMIFRMLECRVQRTRHQKRLPEFSCEPVGTVEFTQFAKTVDRRIKTSCLACPPNSGKNFACAWKFKIAD